MAHFVFYESEKEKQRKEQEAARLRSEAIGNRMTLSLYRLSALLRKANFNPNQPRVPAGNPDGGEWTRVPGWAKPHTAGGRRVDKPNKQPQLIPAVYHAPGSDPGTNIGRPASDRIRPTNVAVGRTPLMPRAGNSPASQISQALNDIATGRQTSISRVLGADAANATVRVRVQQRDQVIVDISRGPFTIHGTGILSSEPGKVTISNIALASPGLLSIPSSPTQVTIFDASDGTLRVQNDKRLTIRGPLGIMVIDRLPGSYIIP